jgi:hypothetical protein
MIGVDVTPRAVSEALRIGPLAIDGVATLKHAPPQMRKGVEQQLRVSFNIRLRAKYKLDAA